jgi:nitrogen regulatory protein PII
MIDRLDGRGFVNPPAGAPRGAYRPIGNGGFTLIIFGSNFLESSTVHWRGKPLKTTFVANGRLEARVDDDDIPAVGSYPVTVVNPAPGGESNRLTITVIENAKPIIDQLAGDDLTTLSTVAAVAYRHPAERGFTLGVRGGGFVESSVVLWSGQKLRTRRIDDSRLEAILADMDVARAGVFTVAVSSPGPGGGESNQIPVTLYRFPKPMLSQIEARGALPPPPGAATGLFWAIANKGFTLTARGAGFVEASVVRWNDKRLTTKFISDTQLEARVEDEEAGQLGAVAVTVVTPRPGGGESAALTVTVVENPRPSVGSLAGDGLLASPASASPPAYRRLAGNGGFTLTARGAGFVETSTVRWNDKRLRARFISDTELQATVEDDDVARAGAYAVIVSNPKPGGGESSALTVNIVENPKPSISWLEARDFLPPPAGAPTGDAYRPVANRGFTMTVRGAGFVEDSAVKWNDRRLKTTFKSETQLEVALEDDDVAQVGVYAVVVVNPKPGGGESNALTVRVTDNPKPTIASLSVVSARAGAGERTVTVRGGNFTERATARWNGQNRKTTYVSPTEVRITLTSADLAKAGAFAITVANPGPGGGVSNAVTFMVTP